MNPSEQLIEWAIQIKNVMAEELPLFAKEILNYKLLDYSLGLCLNFLFIVSFILFIKYIINNPDIQWKKKSYLDPDIVWPYALVIICAGFTILFFFDFINYIAQIIKIKVAPRLFLFDYIMKLVKK